MKLQRTCARTIPALPWLLNGSLQGADLRQVREHLIQCPACRQELARTRTALAMFTTDAVAAARAPQAVSTATTSNTATASNIQRGRVLRRLSWAAAAAVVVSSFAGLWTAREPEIAPTPRPDVASATPAAKAATGQPEQIFTDNFDRGSASGWREQL